MERSLFELSPTDEPRGMTTITWLALPPPELVILIPSAALVEFAVTVFPVQCLKMMYTDKRYHQ